MFFAEGVIAPPAQCRHGLPAGNRARRSADRLPALSRLLRDHRPAGRPPPARRRGMGGRCWTRCSGGSPLEIATLEPDIAAPWTIEDRAGGGGPRVAGGGAGGDGALENHPAMLHVRRQKPAGTWGMASQWRYGTGAHGCPGPGRGVEAGGGRGPAGPAACGRACLEGFIDQYRQALIVERSSVLPMGARREVTGNGSTPKLGDGLRGTVEWATTGDLRRPGDREAGAFVPVESGRLQALLGLHTRAPRTWRVVRVPARGRRQQGAGDDPAGPVFLRRRRQPANRADRLLQAIADSYFDRFGTSQGADKLTPFDPNCQRIENGQDHGQRSKPQAAMHDQRRASSPTSRPSSPPYVSGATRIVDQQKGPVLAQVFFDHAGSIKVRSRSPPTARPCTCRRHSTPPSRWGSSSCSRPTNRKADFTCG